MTIGRKFTAVPDLQANSGLSQWQISFLTAAKKNGDLLAGFQGPTYRAVVSGDVTVTQVEQQGITGEFVAADHLRIATELILVRRALNELIDNINE